MPQPIQELFNKYLQNQCSPEEVEMLMQYFHTEEQFQLNQLILNELEKQDEESSEGEYDELLNRVYGRIHTHIHQPKTIHRSIWLRIAAAASILLFLSIGGYYIFHKQPAQQLAQIQKPDIAPGTNQATLTLANGKKIILTKALSGKLAQQGNTSIQVNSGNAIAYTASDNPNNSTQSQYNTLSTATGEQSPYPLVLGDGTKVWLNAESSITFPVAFNGKERSVKVTGEAYFEVAHNAAKPFKVITPRQTIEDIGTAFNVNVYENEPLAKTTLIEGTVKVSGVLLKPGQQAINHKDGDRVEVTNEVNTHVITAWKDGYFRFDLETLPGIMRELSRWYNVEVVYESKPTDQQFNMKVLRKSNLSRALLTLTRGGVNYRLEGRKLIIKP